MATSRFLALAALLISFFLLSGCWLDSSTGRPDGSVTLVADPTLIDPAVSIGIVRLLNEDTTTLAYLHDAVGVTATVAAGIVAHRQGPDTWDGTADDAPFESLHDLWAIDEVEAFTIELLGEAALYEDLVPVRSVEDVYFSAGELENTLLLINEAEEHELTQDVGLDARPLNSILVGRPFEDLIEVSNAPQVGPAALRELRDYATALIKEEAA